MNPRAERDGFLASHSKPIHLWTLRPSRRSSDAASQHVLTLRAFGQIAGVFLAYFVAGKLGQATSNIRSSNLGPVWPASGIALAGFLAYGYRVWPAIALSAFLVALGGAVSPLAAAGQSIGATLAAAAGTFLLRRVPHFDPALPRLRDALGLMVLGGFGSSIVSSSIGTLALYATGIQPYSGLLSAWVIYWLGDGTGILLVTPLVFTVPDLFRLQSRARIAELAALVALLTAACIVVFGDLPLFPIRLHALAFAVLPFVMWSAIHFGIAGAAFSVFLIATVATLLTAFGFGPFSANTAFTNAVLLDVLFAVLAVTGLSLAAVIAERERAESEREQLIRQQTEMEARLRLAAIVESSDDAICSTNLDSVIQSWNSAAHRIFGFSEEEAIGCPVTILIPPELQAEENEIAQRLRRGERIEHVQTVRMTKAGVRLDMSLTVSPLRDATGRLVGAAHISRDITEQKRAEEALGGLNRKLIDAQEEERARISRELHDDIGQRLALLTVQLTGVADGVAGSHELRRQLIDLEQQVSKIASDVQALSRALHSSKLDVLGIGAGMKLFCREFADQQNVNVDLEIKDIRRQVPPNISLNLFRILQEALHNSVKHSGVRQCEVQLWEAENWIHLVVKDRGAGFDVATSRRGRGLGLVSMEERIKLVDGVLSIDSQPQHGATIHARVPLSR